MFLYFQWWALCCGVLGCDCIEKKGFENNSKMTSVLYNNLRVGTGCVANPLFPLLTDYHMKSVYNSSIYAMNAVCTRLSDDPPTCLKGATASFKAATAISNGHCGQKWHHIIILCLYFYHSLYNGNGSPLLCWHNGKLCLDIDSIAE